MSEAPALPGLDHPIPVFLLTGFLGSGKTSLINRMLTADGPRTTVIINEFGDVPIDNDLVQIDGEAASFATTSTGCICCTPGSDALSALEQLSEAIDDGRTGLVERVVIETTGLADPAPIINQLLAAAKWRVGGRLFELAGVVTTLDAVRGGDTVNERLIGHKQLAFADRVALTKSDLLGADAADRRGALEAVVAKINPKAQMIDIQDPAALPQDLLAPGQYVPSGRADILAWLEAESPIARAFAPKAKPNDFLGARHVGIYTKSLVLEAPIAQEDMVTFLDFLIKRAGPDLLRMKGLVALADDPERPVVLHMVECFLHEPERLDSWPSDDHRTRLVFIADRIDEAALEKLAQQLLVPRRKEAAARELRLAIPITIGRIRRRAAANQA